MYNLVISTQTSMWIRGTQNKKVRPPSREDKAHGKGRNYSNEYWVQRIHAAIGDGLLRLKFHSVHASGLYSPQIAATLAVTSKGKAVVEGQQGWSVLGSPFLLDKPSDSAPPKKQRHSGGSNLMPVIEALLASASNWYEITETSQYQFPGVFQDAHRVESPPRLGHVLDVTKLPHFTGQNHHLLYNENQLSKGHYNDNARTVIIDGEKRNVRIRYAACQGVLQCTEKECSFAGSKRAKKCPKHPTATLESTRHCPVYIVYVYPTDYENNHECWITGVTKEESSNISTSNLHNHVLPQANKVPTTVENAVKEAVRSNPGLTPSQMSLGKWREHKYFLCLALHHSSLFHPRYWDRVYANGSFLCSTP